MAFGFRKTATAVIKPDGWIHINSALLHVSANNAVIFKDIKYKGMIHMMYKTTQ